MVSAEGCAGAAACVTHGVIRRKWATARSWRGFFASEVDWLLACFLYLCGRARWASLLPAVTLRLANDPEPLHLRPGSSDFATFREVFVDREYEPASSFATPPTGVLDLGANVGLAARWLRRQFPHVRVMCVEPDHHNAALAARNLAAAIASESVVFVRAFAGGTARAAWVHSPGRGLANECRLADEPGTGAAVPVHTVADLLARCPFPIDMVKMDVEGSEREIFAGELSWLRTVRDVIVEVHAPLDEAWLRGALPAGGPARIRAVRHRHAGACVAWVTCQP